MSDLTIFLNFTCGCSTENRPQRVAVPASFEDDVIRYTITEDVFCPRCEKQPRFVVPEIMLGAEPGSDQNSGFTSVKLSQQDLVDGLVDGLVKIMETKF